MKSFLHLILFATGTLAAAESRTLHFASESPAEYTRIALTIEGDQVYGTQIWQPKDAHGARGTLSGAFSKNGLIRVLYEYTIEGSDQTEEEILKLEGDKLYIGEGELVEQKPGRLKLKNPDQVTFKKVLSRVAVEEPKAGTPERKAIMDAMRGTVSAFAGKAVTFTGHVRTSGAWASFNGAAAPADGKAPKDEDIAFALELDLFVLLKRDPEDQWQVLDWAFAGDVSAVENAREQFHAAPWVLFPF